MTARVEVCGSVLADRIVATSDVSARHAETKMYPLHPQLEALFATVGSSRLYFMNLIEVTASVFHC